MTSKRHAKGEKPLKLHGNRARTDTWEQALQSEGFMYSRLPHNPYPSVDCPGYGVSGSMDFKERPNKVQTNKIFF